MFIRQSRVNKFQTYLYAIYELNIKITTKFLCFVGQKNQNETLPEQISKINLNFCKNKFQKLYLQRSKEREVWQKWVMVKSGNLQLNSSNSNEGYYISFFLSRSVSRIFFFVVVLLPTKHRQGGGMISGSILGNLHSTVASTPQNLVPTIFSKKYLSTVGHMDEKNSKIRKSGIHMEAVRENPDPEFRIPGKIFTFFSFFMCEHF